MNSRKLFRSAARPEAAKRKLIRGHRTRFEQLETRALMTGDSILHWNAISLQAEANDKSGTFGTADAPGPTGASRALAVVHVAMFDAINSIKGKYEPFLMMVSGAKGANIDAAVGQAAHDTLVAMFPKQKTFFDAELASWLGDIQNGKAENMGIAVGKKVAAACVESREDDGSTNMMDYQLTNASGHHQPDPLHSNQGFLGPEWRDVTPFGMDDVSHFKIPSPPALDSAAYAAAYNEVKNFGGDGVNSPTQRTADQTEIGLFWAYDGSKGLGTPPRLYNQIVVHIAEQMHNTEYENARLLTLVNVAMADAGIACWDMKYVYDLWRPVVGIRNGASDGNAATTGDANWTPLGAPASNQSGTNFTPPFPSYASGHATFGAATFQILKRFYDRNHIGFTFTSDELNGVTTDQNGVVRPLSPRSFSSFDQAMEENGQSRIYLGIHWAFDKTAGIAQGKQIANFVFRRIMEPLKHCMSPSTGSSIPVVAFLQDSIACTLMDRKDGVSRQVVMMQSVPGSNDTKFKFASAPNFITSITALDSHSSSSAVRTLQALDDVFADLKI